MCGIFLYVKSYYKHIPINLLEVNNLYNKISRRGPDQHNLTLFGNDIIGFHRLAINDLTNKGNQPFHLDGDYLMCNGEIYNHLDLEKKYGVTPESRSDCECLLPIFKQNELYAVLPHIDGVFSIIAKIGCKYYFARDRIGVKPLFIFKCDNFIAAASDPSALEFIEKGEIIEVKPGTIVTCDFSFNFEEYQYFTLPDVNEELNTDVNQIIDKTRQLLISAVEKRLMSERPVGCLLSGGLDSSIISSIVAQIYRRTGKKLRTFSVGFKDSTDLKFARKVADHIGSEHHELIITPEGALSFIPSIVKNIGTWDITTIRASTPMWSLCQWISCNFEDKVLFSGEGSDEVFGGYLYFHSAPTPQDFSKECSRLVSQLYKYDVLRADRCISGNSLELREPFLDKDLLDYYLSLPSSLRMPIDGYEKWILRKAFDHMLPNTVCWRRKTAFSDGIASAEKPWFKYIQEWTNSAVDVNECNRQGFNTTESYWYYTLFKKYYNTYNPQITYWLPKWQEDCTDPSATTLKIWNKKEH